MKISLFDLFKIGIGPSSSHTIGPMNAARDFILKLHHENLLKEVARIQIETYGSLALTGEGHGTDSSILLGFEAAEPETIVPDYLRRRAAEIVATKSINLANLHKIQFDMTNDFLKHYDELLPRHSNAMVFSAFTSDHEKIAQETYYSIGGGFVQTEKEFDQPAAEDNDLALPFPFSTAKELLDHCHQEKKTIAELCLANETIWHSEDVVRARLLHVAEVMKESIQRGCNTEGMLPGGLQVKRRASLLYQRLLKEKKPKTHKDTDSLDWLNLYALAVGEENAAGGRVVTAPTNGASGVIPAVLNYYCDFYSNVTDEDIVNFLLTAGAIAILYKKGASISGAEVGCQGEIGVASSMAAGALTAVLGGVPKQVENAAEIAMEHHLGMTCDPVGGLVQIPCIERNAMAAIKALNATYLARIGDGSHLVSLDQVIATMFQTGKDMTNAYKETSLGGLAVNVVGC